MTMHNKFEGWKWLVVVCGVVTTAILFALIGVAIFAILQGRPVSYFSVFIVIICVLLLWAITWGVLWLISGRSKNSGK